MMTDTKALRAVHDAATPGEWFAEADFDGRFYIADEVADLARDVPAEDAAFIVTAKREWLAMCDRIDRMEAALRVASVALSMTDALPQNEARSIVDDALAGDA